MFLDFNNNDISEISFVAMIHLSIVINQKRYVNFQEPIRSAIIDSCVRVNDNGRESMNKKVRNLGLFLRDNIACFLFFTYLTELHCFQEHLIIVVFTNCLHCSGVLHVHCL